MGPGHFQTFARYNAWANGRLYDACQALPEAAYLARRGAAFFTSLHGTLSHVLVGDRAWMRRLTGDGPQPGALDEVPYPTLAPLRRARIAEDARIIDFVGGLDGAALARVVTYRTMAGADHADPMALLLAHLFNHQSHHRGQAHALLSDAGASPPPLDLIYFMRE